MVLDRKVTSMKIDPELWKMVKKHSIDNDISITKFVEDALRRELKNRKASS